MSLSENILHSGPGLGHKARRRGRHKKAGGTCPGGASWARLPLGRLSCPQEALGWPGRWDTQHRRYIPPPIPPFPRPWSKAGFMNPEGSLGHKERASGRGVKPSHLVGVSGEGDQFPKPYCAPSPPTPTCFLPQACGGQGAAALTTWCPCAWPYHCPTGTCLLLCSPAAPSRACA